MKSQVYGLCLGAAVGCSLFGAVVPALAQTSRTPGNTNPDTVAPIGRPPSTPPSEPPAVQAPAPAPSSPFAAVTAFGETLKNNGIYLQLGYVEDILANVSGGLQTGTLPTGELFFGTVLDLQTMLGIPGASFHITFDERNGYALNNIVGTQGPLQANSGPTRSIRLSQFYWEQGFDADRLDIIAGRTNPTTDFATSDISCQLVSSIICAQPGSWYFSNSNQAYPVSTWGGRVNFAVTPNVYIRAGVYDDDPSQGGTDQHGFTWGTERSSGVFIPAEIGYSTSFTTARYPTKVDVGGYYDDANYTTPNGVPMRGRTAYWVQGQQAVYRPDPNTTQSLTVFGGAMVYNGGAPYWGQYYGGVIDRAPFFSRPEDTIVAIGSYYANNSIERSNKPSQWIFEVNYGYSLYPGVTIKPVAQYVINPNNNLAPAGSREPSNAFVIGVQVAINAAAVFGFPQFVPH